MVPTSSLSLELDVAVIDLSRSEFPEDVVLAQEATQVLEVVIKGLRPVLKYVDVPLGGSGARGIKIAERQVGDSKRTLILSSDGDWCQEEGGGLTLAPDGWMFYIFSDIVQTLEQVFTCAVEKRQEHLVAVEARRKKLAEMSAILRSK